MKKYSFVSIMLAVLLALGLVFVSCDNGTTGSDSEPPPYDNLPNLRNYDAIFVGEWHDARQNKEIQLSLIKYYYSEGIRDFAFEHKTCTILFLRYYVETGDEECLDFLGRSVFSTYPSDGQEAYNFWKNLRNWNSTLDEKIRIHYFDNNNNSFDHVSAAIYFFVLRKYPEISGVPNIPPLPGNFNLLEQTRELIRDFRNNKGRYSSLRAEDMELMEKIIASAESGLGRFNGSMNEYSVDYQVSREQFMIANIREIRRNNNGGKIFAIMGSDHASLLYTVPFDGSVDPIMPSLAGVLKNEMRIASISLYERAYPLFWQYNIVTDTSLKVTPFVSTYTGNWPYTVRTRVN